MRLEHSRGSVLSLEAIPPRSRHSLCMPWKFDAPRPYLSRFRRYPSGLARASQPSCLRLQLPSNASCRSLFMCGPSPRLRRVTLTVADFHRFIASPYDDAGLSAQRRISQGKARDFRSIYPPHLRPSGPDDIGLPACLPLRPPDVRLIRFVYLGPELCLWLLSHPASLRRSCHSATGSCHQGPQRTFT